MFVVHTALKGGLHQVIFLFLCLVLGLSGTPTKRRGQIRRLAVRETRHHNKQGVQLTKQTFRVGE